MARMAEAGVLPLPAALAAAAAAAGRVRSAGALAELVELVASLAPRLPPAELSQAIAAASAAGANVERLSSGAEAPSHSHAYVPAPPKGEGGAAVRRAGGKLSVGAGDLRAERAALDSMGMQRLQRERAELRARVSQLTALLGRRARALERVRLDVPGAAEALEAAEEAEQAQGDGAVDEEVEEEEGGRPAARRPSRAGGPEGLPQGGPQGGGFAEARGAGCGRGPQGVDGAASRLSLCAGGRAAAPVRGDAQRGEGAAGGPRGAARPHGDARAAPAVNGASSHLLL